MDNNKDIINGLKQKDKDTIKKLSVAVFQNQALKSVKLCNYAKSTGMEKHWKKLDKKDTEMAKREALHRTVALSTNNKRHVVILNRDAEKNISLIQIISQCSM